MISTKLIRSFSANQIHEYFTRSQYTCQTPRRAKNPFFYENDHKEIERHKMRFADGLQTGDWQSSMLRAIDMPFGYFNYYFIIIKHILTKENSVPLIRCNSCIIVDILLRNGVTLIISENVLVFILLRWLNTNFALEKQNILITKI